LTQADGWEASAAPRGWRWLQKDSPMASLVLWRGVGNEYIRSDASLTEKDASLQMSGEYAGWDKIQNSIQLCFHELSDMWPGIVVQKIHFMLFICFFRSFVVQ